MMPYSVRPLGTYTYAQRGISMRSWRDPPMESSTMRCRLSKEMVFLGGSPSPPKSPSLPISRLTNRPVPPKHTNGHMMLSGTVNSRRYSRLTDQMEMRDPASPQISLDPHRAMP